MREISLHILDIAENSLRAGASRIDIAVDVGVEADLLEVTIRDNGAGMPERMLAGAIDPFVTSRTERRVGLGLPLLAANCRQSGGSMNVWSEPGKGTEVTARFGLTNIDRPPMGRLADTVANLAAANEDRRIVLTVRSQGREFEFDSGAVREQLDGVPMSNPGVAQWLKEYIEEGVRQVAALD